MQKPENVMKIDLNCGDREKVIKIEETRKLNFDVLELYSAYLNNDPRFITKDLIDSLIDCQVSEEYAFYALLSAAFGLDEEKDEHDRRLARNYLLPSVRKLDPDLYTMNPYYRNLKIPAVTSGRWELKYESYLPYEGFIYNDLIVRPDFTEIPRLGFFSKEFKFPAVLENGSEWMTITPNEIETMQPAVDAVDGRVITFGLGLGYFTYMVSEKKQVQSVTVVEKDADVIEIFKEYILPQFPNREKVEIINADAFEYAGKQMNAGGYDYAFADLWHDVSDGFDMYLKMKKLEHFSSGTKYLYWIEDSLLSRLRWLVFESIRDEMNCRSKEQKNENKAIQTFEEIADYLGNPNLRKLAVDIKKIDGP
jgi:hypothetical protein